LSDMLKQACRQALGFERVGSIKNWKFVAS